MASPCRPARAASATTLRLPLRGAAEGLARQSLGHGGVGGSTCQDHSRFSWCSGGCTSMRENTGCDPPNELWHVFGRMQKTCNARGDAGRKHSRQRAPQESAHARAHAQFLRATRMRVLPGTASSERKDARPRHARGSRVWARARRAHSILTSATRCPHSACAAHTAQPFAS